MNTSDATQDYRDVFRIRRFEEEVLALVRSGEITGSVHLCIGQEAVPAGACRSLHPDDSVVATYRGHGWALASGVPMAELFAELLGRASGLCGGRGGSAHLMAPAYGFLGENSIVGAGLPMGLGTSLAAKFQGGGRLALVAVGDGAINQGVVHETLNMAAVLRVPLLVVVENNGYAEMTPADALTAVPAHVRAAAYGIPGLMVDGNDVTAVQAVTAEARERSLTESIPVIVEAMTHRLVGHYSGDAQVYRPKGELEGAKELEPLVRLAHQLADSVEQLRIETAVSNEVREALESARQHPFPDPTTVLDHLYA
ncbi:MAG: thiamine pyrophosphate-dependent dehydrogenase E1 component subunit alpha [Streptosporangiaceae bacterium]